jgi:hypothetical protein
MGYGVWLLGSRPPTLRDFKRIALHDSASEHLQHVAPPMRYTVRCCRPSFAVRWGAGQECRTSGIRGPEVKKFWGGLSPLTSLDSTIWGVLRAVPLHIF